MNKKLLAVAVAGVLAAPAAAFAQSSVTISGFLKMGLDNIRIKNPTPSPSSESRVQDDSSRIIFNVTEDLGGGLQAIAQIDWRVTPDVGADAIGGNNHVGFRSKTWGRILFGRQDIHYFNTESSISGKNSLKADPISIIAFMQSGTAIANATRTTNIVHYTTPNWGGFTVIAAYSTNPNAVEADIGSGDRRGRGWHLNPNFAGANWQIGYSYGSAKADNAAADDQRGDRLYGSYRWGGFKIGLAWDKSKTRAVGGGDTGRRTVWSIPASYEWGNHAVHGHYTRAGDDKVTADRDGAKMWAFGYNYSLSKRTSLGLTYASIKNQEGAAYNFFTSNGGLGSPSASVAANQDPRLFAATVKHTF